MIRKIKKIFFKSLTTSSVPFFFMDFSLRGGFTEMTIFITETSFFR